MPNTSASGGELYTFKNAGEIQKLVKSLYRESPLDRFKLGRTYEVEEMDTGAEAIETESLAVSNGVDMGTGASGQDHSSTYLQVANVDEADIVKADGRYIYAVTNKQEVVIYEASEGNAKKLSTIGSTGVENYISDIFLKGDTLITIGYVWDDAEDGSYAAVVIYDIKDRSDPKFVDQFRQSGQNIVSSRMVGDYVYLVTTTYAFDNYPIPRCTIDGEYKEMDASDISCVPHPTASVYTILSAVDTSSGRTGKSKTKAVFGSSSNIYCNDHNLYIANEEYRKDAVGWDTRVIRASFEGLDVKFNRTAVVHGYINNQFSMDEYDGYFRIATTERRNGLEVNDLYVLDDKLDETGKISGFARDESIKAVRFMGTKAYVITYEAIDPLFVMDLSNPADPRIEGEVMIDGFSSMLVPAGKGRMLGIGYATGDNGYGGQYASGLKLALFDVSDPSEPKVLDSMEFENMDSPAQSTHLALVVNEKHGYYAVPYNINNYDMIIDFEAEGEIDDGEDADYDPYRAESGVLVFGIGGGSKIEVYDRHGLDMQQIVRNVYIDDYIYGITAKGEVSGFRFTKQP